MRDADTHECTLTIEENTLFDKVLNYQKGTIKKLFMKLVKMFVFVVIFNMYFLRLCLFILHKLKNTFLYMVLLNQLVTKMEYIFFSAK